MLRSYATADAPSFLYYLSAEQLAAESGQALVMLAGQTPTGRNALLSEAIRTLADAVGAMSAASSGGVASAYPRSALLHATFLVQACLLRGELKQAVAGMRVGLSLLHRLCDSSSPPSAVTGACPDSIRIAERSPDHADAAGLLAAFYDEQVNRYGFADSIEMNSGEFVPPRGLFVVAYRDGMPVGCAGWRWHDQASRTVEIKKAYVAPASRGLGIGRQLLDWLERHAVAAGAERSVLETGVRNTEALRLFASQGYRPVDRYVTGRDPAINRAFARWLRREFT